MAALDVFLYARLSGYSGVSNLVSTRIYPSWLPQNATLPAVTYRQVSGAHEDAMGGTVKERPRWQIDAWATSYTGARALRDQIIAALTWFSGTAGSQTVDFVRILNNGLDLFDEELQVHRVMVDVEIWAEA